MIYPVDWYLKGYSEGKNLKISVSERTPLIQILGDARLNWTLTPTTRYGQAY